MYKKFIHIVFIFFITGFFYSCNKATNALPDLRERYGYADTRPFGAYTAYRMLNNIYSDKFINLSKRPFSKFYKDTHIDSASLYINISNRYFTTEEDAQAVIDFVYEGNTAFIAASVIDTILLSKIFSRQENTDWLSIINQQKYAPAKISLLPDEFSLQDSFSYYYLPFLNYFSEIHGDRGRITGYNQNGKPNFMVFFWGKGRLYLHCEPRAFSNYFLLTANNHLYMKQIMQMMGEKPGNIFWDDYYNKISYRQQESSSTLSEIFKHPPLAMAFWILLLLLLLYILFQGKRRQRVVPVIHPVQNTSIAFTEAVAGLYLTEKNNKNIANKMISYFNEHIRTRYFLNMNNANTDTLTALSKKSGVAFDKVQALNNALQQTATAEEVSDFELLSLNEQIQYFYKK